jgi:predicted RNase H-like nuclease (RuvC/YqgF family)
MLKRSGLFLISLACVLAVMADGGRASLEREVAASGQDVTYLSGRISSLEQRFYSLESSINQLRQQMNASRPSTVTPNTHDPEVDRLRSEIQLLQERIREVECAAAKLDERTLSQAAREARRAGRQGADPCRLRSETPVQLSARPR